MSDERTYGARLTLVRLLGYVIQSFLTVIVPALFVWGVLHPDAETQVPPFLVIPWILIMAWNWFVVLSRPHRLYVDQRGMVSFISVLRTTQIHAGAIEAIRPAFWGQGEVIVRHRDGRIRLFDAYDDFDRFLEDIRRVNPNLKVEGKEYAPFP